MILILRMQFPFIHFQVRDNNLLPMTVHDIRYSFRQISRSYGVSVSRNGTLHCVIEPFEN